MSQQNETPPSFDFPSPLNSSNEPQLAGLSIENHASRPRLDHVFNFQIVVFQVSSVANVHMIKRSQHFSKRSRIRSFRFLGMASTFRVPLSRKFLHYGRHQRTILRRAVLKIPSICQESRRTIFGPSCASYIHCAFWWYSQWDIRMLMIKWFSMEQTPLVEFHEWIGVLNLANKWSFQNVRPSLFHKFSVFWI